METTIVYWGYIGTIIGIMEKKMETTTVYWDDTGMMERKCKLRII